MLNFLNKILPRYNNVCFSDLFIWRTDGFETKYFTDNISSWFYPKDNFNSKVIFNIYDNKKILLKKKIFELKKFENIEFIFSKEEFGHSCGFFEAFHLIEKNPEKLNFQDSSTIGYRKLGQKNFSHVHRNHNYSSINTSKKFENPFEIKKTDTISTCYTPQLMFDDAEKIEISLKNEKYDNCNYVIEYYDKKMELINMDNIQIEKLLIYQLKYKARYIKIKSNLLMHNKRDTSGNPAMINRPIIFKHFKNNFDVLHA